MLILLFQMRMRLQNSWGIVTLPSNNKQIALPYHNIFFSALLTIYIEAKTPAHNPNYFNQCIHFFTLFCKCIYFCILFFFCDDTHFTLLLDSSDFFKIIHFFLGDADFEIVFILSDDIFNTKSSDEFKKDRHHPKKTFLYSACLFYFRYF